MCPDLNRWTEEGGRKPQENSTKKPEETNQQQQQLPETPTNQNIHNKLTPTRIYAQEQGVPNHDNHTRKPTNIPEIWKRMMTKENQNQLKPKYQNQTRNIRMEINQEVNQTSGIPDNNQKEPSIKPLKNVQKTRNQETTASPRLVQLKPPKKNDTPTTRKPRTKTRNQKQPSPNISSITKFFETVFIPKEPEPESQNQKPTRTEQHNDQKPAATNINITRLTTKIQTKPQPHVRQDVLPENDDNPLEFPSTPQTSLNLNLPTISDAPDRHISPRNLPTTIISRNLPTLSSAAPELGLGKPDCKGDNMCTRPAKRNTLIGRRNYFLGDQTNQI